MPYRHPQRQLRRCPRGGTGGLRVRGARRPDRLLARGRHEQTRSARLRAYLRAARCPPEETVFLDGVDWSVTGAREAGVHAVRYRDSLQAIRPVSRWWSALPRRTGRPCVSSSIFPRSVMGPSLTAPLTWKAGPAGKQGDRNSRGRSREDIIRTYVRCKMDAGGSNFAMGNASPPVPHRRP